MIQVKVFDEEHEEDLEAAINDFLATIEDQQVVDIKYQIAISNDEDEQIYCFSAMVIYRT
jgi:Sporulation protein Cse60